LKLVFIGKVSPTNIKKSDFKMAASQCAITFRLKSGRVEEELEFKKSST